MYQNRLQKNGPGRRSVAVRALGLLALLACVATSAWAGSDERKGTGGAHELRIPVGARGTALGSGVSSDVTGIEAIFWNPAGLAGIEGTEAMFSNTQYFADMTVNYAAVATKMGGLGVMGLNAKVLSVGDVIVTTESAPEGTGDILNPTFTVLGFTWARQFTDRVNFGGTFNWVNESIQSTSASGVAFDFGVQYMTGWNGLKLGMAMKNFGNSMRYTGSDFELSVPLPDADPTSSNRTLSTSSSAFEMPSFFTLSATYDLMAANDYRLIALGAFQNNNFVGDNVSGGLEWMFKDTFALRGSYMGSIVQELDLATGDENVSFESGDDLYAGFAFGAGANVRLGDTRLGVDVSYRPVEEFFDDVVEVGLKLKF
jgi:hypothetical protein